MTTHYVLSGQQFGIRRQAFNGFGTTLTTYSALSTDFVFKDELDVVYPHTMSPWVNGVATFTLTAPVVTSKTDKILTRLQDSVPITVNPDILPITIVPPYKGKLDLTGSVLATDYVMDIATNELFDYSLNGGIIKTTTSATIPTEWFNGSSQYKTSPSGSLITHGHTVLSKYPPSGSYSSGNQAAAVPTFPSINRITDLIRTDALCANIPDTSNLPVKTMIGVYVRRESSAASSDLMSLMTYNFCDHLSASLDNNASRRAYWTIKTQNSSSLCRLIIYANNVTKSIVDVTGQFNLADELIVIAVTLTPASTYQSTLSLYVNGVFRVSDVVDYSSVTASTWYSSLGGMGLDSSTLNTGDGYAQLDYAAYSDIKDADFILTQAAAWGVV